MWSALSAMVIYLRGIAMNVFIVLPFLLVGAALLALLKPNTRALAEAPSWLAWLPDSVRTSGWPLSICSALFFGFLLAVYAFGVSISPIQRKSIRKWIARVATIVLVLCALPIVFEVHFALLRVMFGSGRAWLGSRGEWRCSGQTALVRRHWAGRRSCYADRAGDPSVCPTNRAEGRDGRDKIDFRRRFEMD